MKIVGTGPEVEYKASEGLVCVDAARKPLIDAINGLLTAIETGSNMEMFDAEKKARELLKTIKGESDDR